MRIFNAGVPYGPDIKRLNEAFPAAQLIPESIIPHEELEAIVRARRGTGRYYGVVNSWTKGLLSEHRIYLRWEQRVGLKVLSAKDTWTDGRKRTRQKIRQTQRASRILTYVNRNELPESERPLFDHDLEKHAKMAAYLSTSAKEMALPVGPIQSLPKRQLLPEASKPCVRCAGSGKIGDAECLGCHGSGKVA